MIVFVLFGLSDRHAGGEVQSHFMKEASKHLQPCLISEISEGPGRNCERHVVRRLPARGQALCSCAQTMGVTGRMLACKKHDS